MNWFNLVSQLNHCTVVKLLRTEGFDSIGKWVVIVTSYRSSMYDAIWEPNLIYEQLSRDLIYEQINKKQRLKYLYPCFMISRRKTMNSPIAIRNFYLVAINILKKRKEKIKISSISEERVVNVNLPFESQAWTLNGPE